ncbi:MAG: YfhO family protein [Clostridia bacterium]|nr:YfhO family protein [Clostridia bacterium]
MQHLPNGAARRFRDNQYVRAFVLGLMMSFLVFLPFVIVDNGLFLYYGDFNVQQVPFYQLCHDAIRSGNWGWSHLTDLGANFIGSYSFYLLGSPFFWLTIPFPSEAVPYLMAPLLVLKFACATLTGYIYLRRYAKTETLGLVGAILYAFSGFSSYNVFFNHFHEVIVFFPLLLWAMDEYMEKRRRGVFAMMVCVCCLVNYYFFTGMVAFCVIYWLVRMFSRSWERISVRDFLLLLLESVLGVGMACVLLLPSCLAVLQNNRINNHTDGWSALLYDRNQRYIHILQSLFFPPDIPARPNFTVDSGSKWSSLGAYLPMFGMTGVIAWLQMRRHHWVKKILAVLFFMAMVPLLNSMFQLMVSTYYARWFYMLTLMMALATVEALQNSRVNWKRAIKWNTIIVTVFAGVIGLMPKTTKSGEDVIVTYGLEDYPTRLWSYLVLTLLGIAATALVLRWRGRNPQKFQRLLLRSTAVFGVVCTLFILLTGKCQTSDAHIHLIPYNINGSGKINLDDDLDVCRSDFYSSTDNSGMFWQIPTIQCFHSIVPGSIMDFYPSIGVTRDVGSRPDTSHYALRGLTSCKYLFDDDSTRDEFGDPETGENTLMPGWSYVDHQNGYDIWKNDYYVPMGFSYDSYITQDQYEALPEKTRENVLLHCLVLSYEQAKTYEGLLTHLENVHSLTWDQEQYFTDCQDRAKTACSSFAYTTTGFTAEAVSEEERLIFFSVPYEDGWSATVNGQEAPVEKVSVGFMAVRVPAGENHIVFTYTTPGLKTGALISAGSLVLLLLYLFLTHKFCRRRESAASPSPFTPRPFSHFTDRHPDSHFTAHKPIALKTEENPLAGPNEEEIS